MRINSLQSGQSTRIRSLQLKLFLNDLTNLMVIMLLFLLTSCSEINTTNTKEIYKYWAGKNPPSDIKLLQGHYWESGHWSGEYIMYLKFKSTDKWWNTFIKKNHLLIDKTNWIMPTDAPSWFKPSANLDRYNNDDDFDQGSRYFRDPLTQVCYVYEIQL
ncbi:hypothetical protein [Flavobacterium sp. JAS]|uniref:hypothetical protein n=1 Tax=Flavobacterium sp. JAS TaxID=2897329 RepID=UPI001E5CEED0|nr:hypothetical protein [Flavobacterium sp. JAS]MCD0468734.1 hypothetical protein [Flavobacterium sp. JAS]